MKKQIDAVRSLKKLALNHQTLRDLTQLDLTGPGLVTVAGGARGSLPTFGTCCINHC